ncbi:MAG TPA: TRAP transporter large permease [Burkholderiales bacterium]|nr:TRAP transporter large permease [Burkholderiales bacterium]
MDEKAVVALAGFGVMLALMLIRVPIGVCLGLVAIGGFAWLNGVWPALGLLVHSPIRTVTDFNFSVIPMFILMGVLVSRSGMSRELFRAAAAWFGHLPGGMAVATVFASGGFAAINGSAIANATTMATVALPEMRRHGYDPGLSMGVIAAGGTLGPLIPPSVLFVLYGILVDENISRLFIAGILPGILAMALYCIAIQLVYWYRPHLLPRGALAPWHERWASLKEIWATLLLFAIVIGGLYGGFVTVVEAASLGVMGALFIGVVRRRLPWREVRESLVEALRTSAAIFLLIIGVFLFQYFLAITQTSQQVAQWLSGLQFAPITIIVFIVIGFLLAGTFIDEVATMLLTVPILHPVVVQLGFDPVWFGVLVVTTATIGMIAPPVGIICFILNSMVREISLMTIYRGVMPFVAADLVRLTLLVAFPAISLVLPRTMS